MRQYLLFIATVSILAGGFSHSNGQGSNQKKISRIAFGSCAKEYKSQPILESVIAQDPELFIYLGDNIYGDTRDMDVLRAKYVQLGNNPAFQALNAQAIVRAIWDDHDYGENDAGRHYPFKVESKEIFLDFWKEPKNSERRKHEGIYHAEYFGEGDQVLQLIMLDTRSFRDDLLLSDGKPDKHRYAQNNHPDSTILGAEQWAWLAEELKKPATFRIIASSIQFGHQYNGWESWNNFPLEQARMFEVIKGAKAEGVLLLSGDVHYSEISVRQPEGLYPVYDITSSGMTHTIPVTWPNRYRVGRPYGHKSFGYIEIDWEKDDPTITFELKKKNGKTVREKTVKRSDLKF